MTALQKRLAVAVLLGLAFLQLLFGLLSPPGTCSSSAKWSDQLWFLLLSAAVMLCTYARPRSAGWIVLGVGVTAVAVAFVLLFVRAAGICAN